METKPGHPVYLWKGNGALFNNPGYPAARQVIIWHSMIFSFTPEPPYEPAPNLRKKILNELDLDLERSIGYPLR